MTFLERPAAGRFVLLCLALAAMLRTGAILLAVERGWTYPSVDETRVANALLQGRGFVFDWFGLFGADYVAGAFFPPAYVYNVYLLYRLFGTDLALFAQNGIFSLGVSLCLYILARRAFGLRTARLALLVSVFYIPFFSRLTHGSPVYFKMFFMCLLVLLLDRSWNDRSKLALAPAGAVCGLLALAMPDVLVYLGLVTAVLVLRGGAGRAAVVRVLVFVGAAALVIAPWTARNWREFGRFCLISTNGGMNFYMGNNPRTVNEVELNQIIDLDRQLDGRLARADEFERDAILYREGWHHLLSHPLISAGNMAARALMHWTFRIGFLTRAKPDGTDGAPAQVLYTWSYVLSYVPLLLLALRGVWLERRRWGGLVPILGAFAYSTLVAMLFVAQTKQRLIKVEPFMVLFAAAALAGANPRPGRQNASLPPGRPVGDTAGGLERFFQAS